MARARIGRPPADLGPDPEKRIQKLAALQLSLDEMGAVMGCSADTLTRRFAEAIEKGRLEGRASLKRTQFAMAMGVSYEVGEGDEAKRIYTRLPDRTMLVWLGKVVLGQREPVQRIANPDDSPLGVPEMSDDELAARIMAALGADPAARGARSA